MLTSYPELASVGLGFKGGTSSRSASGRIHVKVEVVAHIHIESGLIILSRIIGFKLVTVVTNHHCTATHLDPPLAGVRVTLPAHLLVPIAAAGRGVGLSTHGHVAQGPAAS